MAWSPQLLGQQENWMANSNSPMLQQYGQMQQFQQNYNNPAAEWNKYTSGLRDMGFNEVRDLRAPGYTNTQSNSNQKNFDWSQAGDYLKGGSNLATAVFQDITDILGNSKSQITQKPTYDLSHVNSFDDLNNTSFTFADSNQLTRPTFGSSFMDINMRTARGAIAGSALGPWGMLGGAIGGTLSGVANSITKAVTYKKDLNRLNTMNANMMQNYNKDFAQAFNNINNNQQMNLDMQRSRRLFAEGGQLNTTINTGGTHEQNPYGGVQMGIASDGQPNLVEEGEVVYNDYVFSNRIKPQKDILQKFNTGFKKSFNSYANIANHINKLHEEFEHDPMHKSTKDIQMQRLAEAQEYQKLANEAAEYGMNPEEYLQYQQNVQAEQMQQQMQTIPQEEQMPQTNMLQSDSSENIMAFGGHIFGKGGNTQDFYYGSPHVQNRIVKNYWENSSTRAAAYALDKFGDYYLRIKNGQDIIEGRSADEKFNAALTAALPYLKNDPKAQVYLKDRLGLSNGELNSILGSYNIPTSQHISYSAQDRRIARNNGQPLPHTAEFQFTNYTPKGLSTNTTNLTTETNLQTTTNQTNKSYSGSYSGNITSVNPTYQYYNPATKQLVQQDAFNQLTPEEQNLLYKITNKGGKGYDGKINYSWNPAYMDKFNALTDDDWKTIQENLGEPYANTSLNKLKGWGNDNLFGNVHKAAIDYIWNRDYNKPVETTNTSESTNVPEVTPDTNTATKTISPTTTQMQQGTNTSPWKSFWGANNPLRYAPVFDNMRSLLTQNKPDMTYSNQLASLYKPLTHNPTGQRMYYNPVDQYYLSNQAQQARNTQLAAARNNANTAQANAYYQSIANQQMNNLIADNYIKALQQNDQIRNTALQYNNQLDAQNEANRLNVQSQNASNYAQIMGNSYQAAEEERLTVENAREANKQNMAMNLGVIGKEQSDHWNVSHNPALLYGAFGTNYKG